MEKGKSIDFSIDKDLAEKFHLALTLNKETSKDVITRFMKQYVAESFSKASKEYHSDLKSTSTVPNINDVNLQNEGKDRKSKSSSSTKITNEMIETSYNIAKKVYFGQLSRQEGKLAISNATGMNPGSAQDYITDFLSMMDGKEYQRVMSNYGTTYFLENIRKDFGERAFQKAIEATEKHIKYYNALGYGRLKAKEEIVERFKQSIN
ncbi:hypothetical protein HHO41_19330 [Bacillus sp. DNRA2]|uniref:hypothetical protein n=1 Tax=Bacillus sp. DNRA2 TaxID=2723053 RepID=UPI00145F8E59|nr:hypothetical protein [Bacillus sp. DNRA2]NMD72427.1 hypothetical protein [Bacillus sp. DNRA2]